jgi:hypothetical protein
MTAAPPQLIEALKESASGIDATFARAGSELAEGLTLLGAHGQILAGMSATLGEGQMEKARSALAVVAREMSETQTKFAAETAILTRFANRGNRVGELFAALRRNMRVVTIVTRSTRIEGSSVKGASADFGDFTDEIVSLTSQASETVESCMRDHAALWSTLAATLEAQREFERRFSTSLSTLAERITHSLDEVSRARSRDAEIVSRLAERSGRLSRATGEAIVSLQSGDNIRQRLEHVMSALGLESDHLHRSAAVAIRNIQAAQLQATSDILRQECRRIDGALRLVGSEASGLVDLVKGVYGGEAGASVLVDLQRNLAQAIDLLRQCEAARQAVDSVVDGLTSLLDRFEATMGRLTKTVSDIVLIGINAGLKASQLGGEGRSLVVVAQQLKSTADEIARDARELNPLFTVMIAEAAPLRERSGQSERLTAIEDSIGWATDIIRTASDHLASILLKVEDETSRCLRGVETARSAFAMMGRRADTLAAIGHELPAGFAGSPPDGDEADRVLSFLRSEVRGRYTMIAERTIFDRVLHSLGLAEGAPPAPPPTEDAITLFA